MIVRFVLLQAVWLIAGFVLFPFVTVLVSALGGDFYLREAVLYFMGWVLVELGLIGLGVAAFLRSAYRSLRVNGDRDST